MAKDDDEKMAEFIIKQVERERQKKGNDDEGEGPKFTELKRSSEDDKITLGLKLSTSSTTKSTFVVPSKDLFRGKKVDKSTTKSEKRKTTSALEEIMKEEESKKRRAEKDKAETAERPWLQQGIVVKVITKSLGEKYYKQKGHVRELVDKYTGIIVVSSTGAKVKLDQQHLETVIPAVGRRVLILNGKHKGEEAQLEHLIVEKFSADLLIKSGSSKNETITLPYEHFSKKCES